MNYLPVHVFVEGFSFCNLPFPPLFSLFPASRQDLDLSKLQHDTKRVLLSLMVKRFQREERVDFTVSLGQEDGGRTVVITAPAVQEFTEVYQLTHN